VVAPTTVKRGSFRRMERAEALADDDIEGIIFHAGRDLFDGFTKAVDFIDKEDVTGAQVVRMQPDRQRARWPGRR